MLKRYCYNYDTKVPFLFKLSMVFAVIAGIIVSILIALCLFGIVLGIRMVGGM